MTQPGPQLGLRISGYELIKVLGDGTVSTTYLAQDEGGKNAVAKRLLNHLVAEPGLSDNYLQAVGLSSKVKMRRFVATVTGQKSSPDGIFLLREYVEGQSLSDFLRTLPQRAAQESNLPQLPAELRQLAEDLGEGLRSLSQRGIVHGGLHLGNVIVQADGRARITDFGTSLSQLGGKLSGDYPLDRLRYLAPEQWNGQPADVKSDIYSLGLIFARLLSKEEVFPTTKFRELGLLVQAGLKRSESVLAAALEPNPARRLGDVEKLRDGLKALDFEALLRGLYPRVPVAPPPVKPTIVEQGQLVSLFDLRGQRELLAGPAIPPVPVPANLGRQELPFSLANGGDGMLSLRVEVKGSGIKISPQQLDIAPGQRGTVRIDLAADSDRFANLFFHWDTQEGPQELVLKIFRP